MGVHQEIQGVSGGISKILGMFIWGCERLPADEGAFGLQKST